MDFYKVRTRFYQKICYLDLNTIGLQIALFFYSLIIYKELENSTLIKIPFQSMIRQIDKSLKNRDNSVRGLMANEIHKHLDLCVERNEDFLGRDVDLYKVIVNSK